MNWESLRAPILHPHASFGGDYQLPNFALFDYCPACLSLFRARINLCAQRLCFRTLIEPASEAAIKAKLQTLELCPIWTECSFRNGLLCCEFGVKRAELAPKNFIN